MTDIQYIGKDKDPNWLAKEQEKVLRETLGDKMFEWLEEIERERKERWTHKNGINATRTV